MIPLGRVSKLRWMCPLRGKAAMSRMAIRGRGVTIARPPAGTISRVVRLVVENSRCRLLIHIV
jgi:hypothetical protein